MISTIENLPNELFIEIFQYLSPVDLYNSFFNINLRFNVLIRSLKNFHFIQYEDWDTKEQHIPYFSSQISTLIIHHDESVNFSHYSNIRCLKLLMPSETQCNSIQSAVLPFLEHIHISNLFFSNNTEQLCRSIFSSLFSRLKTCYIDRMTLDENHCHYSLSLEELTISPCTWQSNMLKQILHACPNLIYLRLIRLRNKSFDTFPTIQQHLFIHSVYIHYDAIGNQFYKQIDWLLLTMPKVENLIIDIEQCEVNIEFSFDIFARILVQHAPYLMRIKARIPLDKFSPNQIDFIKGLHPLFVNVHFQRYINPNLNSYLVVSSHL